MKIILATHNKGKLKEVKDMLADFQVFGAEEVGVFEDVVEDGETFAENALKKARFVAQKTGEWAVADDSGICIKALGGRPGVHSARWAGENSSDEDKVALTLGKIAESKDIDRSAYFESNVALVSPSGEEHVFVGRVEGKISDKPAGINRPKLPYDLIFIPEGHNRTFAQMSDEEKNSMSHRGRAFEKLKKFLVEMK